MTKKLNFVSSSPPISSENAVESSAASHLPLHFQEKWKGRKAFFVPSSVQTPEWRFRSPEALISIDEDHHLSTSSPEKMKSDFPVPPVSKIINAQKPRMPIGTVYSISFTPIMDNDDNNGEALPFLKDSAFQRPFYHRFINSNTPLLLEQQRRHNEKTKMFQVPSTTTLMSSSVPAAPFPLKSGDWKYPPPHRNFKGLALKNVTNLDASSSKGDECKPIDAGSRRQVGLWDTTYQTIGSEPPQDRHFPENYFPLRQEFTSAFPPPSKSRNRNLNTSITKSRIHSKLDHCFSM